MGAGTGKLDVKLRAVGMGGIVAKRLSVGISPRFPGGFGIVFCLPKLTFVCAVPWYNSRRDHSVCCCKNRDLLLDTMLYF